MQFIWIIQANKSRNIVGCFETQQAAEAFIHLHKIPCILQKIPVNIAIYDWVIQQGYWQPKYESQKTTPFIAQFNSAYLQHEHYYSSEDDSKNE